MREAWAQISRPAHHPRVEHLASVLQASSRRPSFRPDRRSGGSSIDRFLVNISEQCEQIHDAVYAAYIVYDARAVVMHYSIRHVTRFRYSAPVRERDGCARSRARRPAGAALFPDRNQSARPALCLYRLSRKRRLSFQCDARTSWNCASTRRRRSRWLPFPVATRSVRSARMSALQRLQISGPIISASAAEPSKFAAPLRMRWRRFWPNTASQSPQGDPLTALRNKRSRGRRDLQRLPLSGREPIPEVHSPIVLALRQFSGAIGISRTS